MTDKKLTASQVAVELKYHVNHVYRLLAQGKIRGEQFGQTWMVDKSEVERVKAMQDEHGRLS